MAKLKDFQIADNILDIIYDEIQMIKRNPDRSPADIVKLEKLSKAYQIIMASNREALKSGMLGGLTPEELDRATDNADDEGEETEEL